jgi:hypothetical protein
MRLLHICSWNIGRVLHREPQVANHNAMLREIAAIPVDVRRDLIWHAGEGFDSLDTTILADALEVTSPLAVSSPSSANLHAVAADLDRVLPVTRNPAGSVVRPLDAAKHEQLLLGDVSAAC